MLRIALSGCNGRMGQAITRLCKNYDNISIVAGFDLYTEKLSTYPVYADPFEYTGEADVIIDFSNVKALPRLLEYATKNSIPVVLATTGYSEADVAAIREASEKTAIFKSANMSLGINVVAKLLKTAAEILGNGYDVEIIERHHNQKLDAPSGTAYILGDAVKEGLPYDAEYVYDRHEKHEKRSKTEIGMHAIRGGTIVGEHEVIFAGTDEIIEFKHTALSREVFANGAIRAAIFMNGKTKGMYSMTDLVESEQ